jgi:hypothetical protein
VSQEYNLAAVDAGVTAAHRDSMLRPYFEKHLARINDEMVRAYRDPETPNERFLCLAAELACIRALQDELRYEQQKGIRALNQELSNAKASD